MSEKLEKLRADLAKAKDRRIQLNNRIELLGHTGSLIESPSAEAEKVEVSEMVRSANLTPEQLAALLRQAADLPPNPALLEAVGATFEKEGLDEG